MDKEKMQQFAARISQANRTELTVIVFELAIFHLEEGLKADSQQDKVSLAENIKKSMMYVNQLCGALDYSQKISADLFSLYRYVNGILAHAMAARNVENLDEAKGILEGLKESFAEVAKTDNSAPLMSNTQQLYAGLTYGKGTLNEVCINSNEANRGYKV